MRRAKRLLKRFQITEGSLGPETLKQPLLGIRSGETCWLYWEGWATGAVSLKATIPLHFPT